MTLARRHGACISLMTNTAVPTAVSSRRACGAQPCVPARPRRKATVWNHESSPFSVNIQMWISDDGSINLHWGTPERYAPVCVLIDRIFTSPEGFAPAATAHSLALGCRAARCGVSPGTASYDLIDLTLKCTRQNRSASGNVYWHYDRSFVSAHQPCTVRPRALTKHYCLCSLSQHNEKGPLSFISKLLLLANRQYG